MIVGITNPLKPLEDLLTSLLEWFHGTVGLSWAWSIVALVVLVRIVLVPVMVRQIHSMQNLQAHAPEMKEIQQRWKHDRQRQNEELMKFYRENKINPAASCLPIVAQIPVFFALYLVLRNFSKHPPPGSLEWLGLVDITEPVRHGWGPLLLVIYVASSLTSSWYMSATMQGAQRVMMMVLPVAFVPFLLNFPSGLMIYWLTTNLWTTGQGVVTRRLIPKPATPDKRSSRTAPEPRPDEKPDSENGARTKSTPQKPSGTVVAGPPRRVKRKRGGGGGRR
ncbi:MAG TPA: YidC/Oxa1 family membrane protein insertase [Gaiella sp.]